MIKRRIPAFSMHNVNNTRFISGVQSSMQLITAYLTYVSLYKVVSSKYFFKKVKKMNQLYYYQYYDENSYQNVYHNQSQQISRATKSLVIRPRQHLKSIENTIYDHHHHQQQTRDRFPVSNVKTERNKRERERVEKVNNEFKNLELSLQNYFEIFREGNDCYDSMDSESGEMHFQRLSKVQTLRYAFSYIELLTDLLRSDANQRNTANTIR